jgi:predicted membrane protein
MSKWAIVLTVASVIGIVAFIGPIVAQLSNWHLVVWAVLIVISYIGWIYGGHHV